MTRRARHEPTAATPERRAADQPAVWMSARARNALRRPGIMTAVGVPVFIAALVALVLVPREAHRAARAAAPRPEDRPDTAALVAQLARAERNARTADSSLAAARLLATQPPPEPLAVDTLSPALIARRDSISLVVGELSRGLSRVEESPLAASFRALGELPALRGDARVRALLDSLGDIERERESFGAIGGIDPAFITLTARATTVGRSIQELAAARRAALRRQLDSLTAPPRRQVVQRPPVDTLAFLAARDSAQAARLVAEQAVLRGRAAAAAYEARVERARDLANLGAPPLALLAAALVVGLVVGYAAALTAELRHPRVADAREAERVTGVRVLAELRTLPPSPERGRRKADREAPPLLESWSDAYRMVYYNVARPGAPLVMLTVTGDDPTIAATVATNFAALAALEARDTLLIDADLASGAVAGVARVRPEPGLAQVIDGLRGWPDTHVSVLVGRDRTIDVVPAGARSADPRRDDVVETLASDVARLARRYDAVVIVAADEQAMTGLPRVLPVTDVVYCARTAHTRVSTLTRAVEGLRLAGGEVRGIVLWDRDEPRVPVGEELATALREGLITTETHAVPRTGAAR